MKGRPHRPILNQAAEPSWRDSPGSAQAVVEQASYDGAPASDPISVFARAQVHPQSWVMSEGSPAVIKWVALVLMVADHANKYLYAERLPLIFQIGRIVMPLFGFVLAYNLARPDAFARGIHGRMMFRLTLMGLAATPVCIVLNGLYVAANSWWPLNILFMLALVVSLTYLIDRGGAPCYALAAVIFLVGGAFVEYLWMGVLCCLGAWLFCRNANVGSFVLWCLGTLSLTLVNGNAWALLAIPLALAAGQFAVRLPRLTWVFYAFYPAHLLLLLGVRWEWY